jgi:hypothetical protein
LEKLPGKLESWGKTESAFFYGNGWNGLDIFFLMFVIIHMRFLWKKFLEKLPGRLENSRKTESAFFYGNGWTDLANFFFNVRNSSNKVFLFDTVRI